VAQPMRNRPAVGRLLTPLRSTRAAQFIQKMGDDRAPDLAVLLAWGLLSALLPLILGTLAIARLLLQSIQSGLWHPLAQRRRAATDRAGDVARRQSAPAHLDVRLQHRRGARLCLQCVGAVVASTRARTWLLECPCCLVHFSGDRARNVLAAVHNPAKQTEEVAPNAPRRRCDRCAVLPHLAPVPLYLSLFGQGFEAYAAFGVFLILMFWLYLLGWVIVIGVEINAFLEGSK
jgi:hypothetical protein